MRILLAPIAGQEADHLLALSDEYMASLYPAESNHLVSSESLRTGDATFIGAFVATDSTPGPMTSGNSGEVGDPNGHECVGCVAARFYREQAYAEIKRLYVAETHRGGGLARQLMAAWHLFGRDSFAGCDVSLFFNIFKDSSKLVPLRSLNI